MALWSGAIFHVIYYCYSFLCFINYIWARHYVTELIYNKLLGRNFLPLSTL